MKSRPERIFSEFLKRNAIKYEFHKHIGPYELDFVIGNLVIEIDGKHHDYSKDGEKNQYLFSEGYITWHFTSNEIRSGEYKQLIDLNGF
jgi:very-short-patch-repair endonuclease